MKKILLASSLLLALSPVVAQTKEGSFSDNFGKIKDGVVGVAEDSWEVTKDAAGDISKSTKKGFNKAQDYVADKIDSLHTYNEVSSAETLQEYLTVEVTGIKELNDNEIAVNVLLKNISKKPVKLSNLMGKTDVIVLSQDQVAHFATLKSFEEGQTLIVPEDAAIQVEWVFKDANSNPVTLRFFGVNYPLPQS